MKWLLCIALLLGSYLQAATSTRGVSYNDLDRERLAALSKAERAFQAYKSYRDRYDHHLDKRDKLVEKKQALRDRDLKAQDALTKLQNELAALIAEKLQALEELRQGYYCSQCGRPKSQVERETKKSFGEHLKDVNGKAEPATPERIQKKSDEYDRKIQKLREKIQKQSEKADFDSKKRWTNYQKEVQIFNIEARKIMAGFKQSSHDYRKNKALYVKLTKDADQLFDQSLQWRIDQRIAEYVKTFRDTKRAAFLSRTDAMRDRIRAGQVTGLGAAIDALKRDVQAWQGEYVTRMDPQLELIVPRDEQAARVKARQAEAARAAKVRITSPMYTSAQLIAAALPPMPWGQFNAAIQVLEQNQNQLQAAAIAQKLSDMADAAVERLKNSVSSATNRISGFFSSSRQSVEDSYREADDYLEENRVYWLLKSFGRNYPGVQNILTDLVGERIDEFREEIDEVGN